MKNTFKLALLAPLIFLGVGCERTGIVEYDDCRTIVELKEDTIQKYYHLFTCDYQKTDSGAVMDATFVRVELCGFYDSGLCNEAFVYNRGPEGSCSDEYPYLGYDDKCYQEWDYGRVRADDNNEY